MADQPTAATSPEALKTEERIRGGREITEASHPTTNPLPIMRHFQFAHLKGELADVSSRFAELAKYVHDELPRDPETTVALRKLLEAKDAAVRCKASQLRGEI